MGFSFIFLDAPDRRVLVRYCQRHLLAGLYHQKIVVIGSSLDGDRVEEGLELLRSRASTGKVVITL